MKLQSPLEVGIRHSQASFVLESTKNPLHPRGATAPDHQALSRGEISMSDFFEITTIFLFDVHTSLRPVLSKNVHQEFRFLVEPDLYRRAYRSGQKIRSRSLEIGPHVHSPAGGKA